MLDQDQGIEHNEYNGLVYSRQRKDSSFPRGTVHLYNEDQSRPGRSITGFPHIKRTYHLHAGIKRLFKNDSFKAEEKLDGYNLRLFSHAGRLLAATRGGFICPFSTEWAGIWAEEYDLDGFFRDYPGYYLCGEVMGDNPYNRQSSVDLSPGAHFFVFEICKPDGTFLPVSTKEELLREYGLPAVKELGTFNALQGEELYALLRDLNSRGKEGVVLKSPDSSRRMKFVTPECDIQDIKDGLEVGFDLDMGFFQSRYMRVVYFVKELGLDKDEYSRKLGRAFMDGIPVSENYQGAREEYTVYLSSRNTWQSLLSMLMSQIKIRTLETSWQHVRGKEMLKVRFARIYTRSGKRYQRMIKGVLHQD